MNWLKPLTIVEFLFIGIFILIYVVYFVRLYTNAKRLGTTAQSIILKFIIRVLYLTLCIIGMLGPSFGVNEIEARLAGKDIYFAVDVSKSMNAVDIEPSRLEKVKFEFIRNLDLIKSDRVGIVLFSSEAFVFTPLTFDKDALGVFVKKINSNFFTDSGTNLNSVFELLQNKINTISNQDTYRTKVVVVVTDGEDFGSVSASLIEQLKKKKIHFFVLGVGETYGAKIREGNRFLKNPDSSFVVSKLDRRFLTKLNKDLSGKYFELNSQKNEVPLLLKELDKTNTDWSDKGKMTSANNKYYYFVVLALFLMMLDIVVTVRTIKL